MKRHPSKVIGQFSYVIGVILLLMPGTTFASDADRLIGTFSFPEQTGLVEFYKKDGAYFGRIAKLPNPDATDMNNQDESLRSRRLVGVDMFSDLTFNADDERWEGGTIYDARSGRSYQCRVWFEEEGGDLSVRGFIGTPLMGQTQVFPRASKQ